MATTYTQASILIINEAFSKLFGNTSRTIRKHLLNSFCILNDITFDPKKTHSLEQIVTSLDLNLVQASTFIKSKTMTINHNAEVSISDII